VSVDVVVDVGNSRIKWGRCDAGGIRAAAALPMNSAAWQAQIAAWDLTGPARWVIAGVRPEWRDALAAWLATQGFDVYLLESARQLPLRVKLEYSERVGIDRLLNAVAANSRRRPGQAALAVDAGSAVTVDYVDPDGAFCGGAIFPGLRLMTQSLHEYTALLPLVEITGAVAPPGTDTRSAIATGVYHAVAGGIRALSDAMTGAAAEVTTFVTGGDARLLASSLGDHVVLWPEMTLEGIRLSFASA